MITKSEINAINIVLQHAGIKSMKKGQRIKANRFLAMRFIFNIPMDVDKLIIKANDSLSKSDIRLLIAAIHEYKADTSPGHAVRIDELNSVLPKLKKLEKGLDNFSRFMPSLSCECIGEVDIFNLDQGIKLLEQEYDVAINENSKQAIFQIFDEELSEEMLRVKRLKRFIMTLSGANIGQMLEKLKNGEIMESLYDIDLLIEAINAYETEQRTWVESGNLLNTRETLKKLFFLRSELYLEWLKNK